MNKCIVIGKTNVGKTLFTLNFADYLGLKKINVVFKYHDESQHSKTYDIKNAIKDLTDTNPHKTRCLQIIKINIPKGKGKKQVKLIDTSGLIDGIHSDEKIRKSISQTLANIKNADLVLHVIDVSMLGKKKSLENMGQIDYQIAQFCQLKHGYAILANKIDLPDAKKGLEFIKEEFQGNYIIPVSALHKKGFSEVKKFVSRNI